MSWLFTKLSSSKSDNIIEENSTQNSLGHPSLPTTGPPIYPSLPQSSYPTPGLPYNIMPTPVGTNSPQHRLADTLPQSLDEMNVSFKFLVNSNIEDLEIKQLETVLDKAKEMNRNLRSLVDEIDTFDFSLEKSVVSSTE